jgi:Glycosyltransferase 61
MSRLLSKVKRKLGAILSKIIPYNQSLRPVGAYSSSKEYLDALGLADNDVKIYDGYTFHLKLPGDLRESAELFEKLDSEVNLPAVIVVNIPQGRLYTDAYNTVAVITPDNMLLHDVSLELRSKQEINPFVNHIFKLKYFKKPQKFSGGVFTLLTGGGGLDNYFHWLFDVLPRFFLLKASGLHDQVRWYLVPAYHFPYQIDTLTQLGILKEQIIDGSKMMHLQADNLIASSPHRNAGQMEKWVCDFLRASFITERDKESNSPAFIYISRNDSRSRNVINEAELITLLENYGFKTVSLTGLSFTDQVRLFNRAKVIVSPHGAGLANLVFCEPGTKILEIFSEGWIGTMYCDLAGKLGLEYYYHVAKVSSPPQTPGEAKHKHFQVDIREIDNIVKVFHLKTK